MQIASSTGIYSKAYDFLKSKKKKLYYTFEDRELNLNLDYCLEEANILHIRYNIIGNIPLSFSKLCVNYEILLGKNPDYIWVPHLRPKKNLIIGDHVFRSPVIIYKSGNISFAFFPDLKTLKENHPFQTFLSLDLNPENDNLFPSTSFGYANYKPYMHVFFRHKPRIEWQLEKKTDLTFRYYIITFLNKTPLEILQFINRFLWEKYGRRLFYESLNPQILPYKINVKEGLNSIFERHKFWGNFNIKNSECGGIWHKTWLGIKKKPIEFLNHENLEIYKRYNQSNRRFAVILNNSWFSNVRTSYGLRFFGELWNEEDLIKRSERILNTIYSLPRSQGIFPGIILSAGEGSEVVSTIKGSLGLSVIEDFNLVDVAITLYWMIKIHHDFNIPANKLVSICEDFLILIEKLQLESGEIPIIINFEETTNKVVIKDILRNSASSGAILMFLTEYHKISKKEKILVLCKTISKFLEKEIVPVEKWHDFEVFYSCTSPVPFKFDKYTNNHIKNTLSMYWTAEGYKELFKITSNEEYLKLGEKCIANLSLFQQVWDMPYISYNTFGGFGCQNVDAELSDARQGLFVKTYMEYYLQTGKWEYMERGIAALRASWALQILEEYKGICEGNLKGISTMNSDDKGCISENYGHNGKDARIPGYIMFDWGIGTAMTATAYAKKHFGDLFIDFKEHFVFGIDGILLKSFDFINDHVILELDVLDKNENIIIKARDVPFDLIEISFNSNSLGKFKKEELEKGIIEKIW
ncbi:MAG: hypothetical protein ACFFA3_06160 [Promethearchaeota archaeon]